MAPASSGTRSAADEAPDACQAARGAGDPDRHVRRVRDRRHRLAGRRADDRHRACRLARAARPPARMRVGLRGGGRRARAVRLRSRAPAVVGPLGRGIRRGGHGRVRLGVRAPGGAPGGRRVALLGAAGARRGHAGRPCDRRAGLPARLPEPVLRAGDQRRARRQGLPAASAQRGGADHAADGRLLRGQLDLRVLRHPATRRAAPTAPHQHGRAAAVGVRAGVRGDAAGGVLALHQPGERAAGRTPAQPGGDRRPGCFPDAASTSAPRPGARRRTARGCRPH